MTSRHSYIGVHGITIKRRSCWCFKPWVVGGKVGRVECASKRREERHREERGGASAASQLVCADHALCGPMARPTNKPPAVQAMPNQS